MIGEKEMAEPTIEDYKRVIADIRDLIGDRLLADVEAMEGFYLGQIMGVISQVDRTGFISEVIEAATHG